jgi:ribosome-associated protein
MQDKTELDNTISKTKLKAEADAVQKIGKKLVDLPKDKIVKLALPELLYEAVIEAKRLTANGAIRRQMQYIGRLMRETDVAPIEEQLQRWEGKNNEENARFHGLERWRDRLLNDIDVVSAFVELYPKVDAQRMRTLIRNAQKEHLANKPPKSSRELFKMLRDVTETNANTSAESDMETSPEE